MKERLQQKIEFRYKLGKGLDPHNFSLLSNKVGFSGLKPDSWGSVITNWPILLSQIIYNYLIKNRNNFLNQLDEFGNMKIDIKTTEDIVSGHELVVTQETTMPVLQDSDGYLVPNTDACHPISTGDLVSWSFQIARGMDYLSSKKVLQLCFRIHHRRRVHV